MDLLRPVTMLIGNIPLRDLTAQDVRRTLSKLAQTRVKTAPLAVKDPRGRPQLVGPAWPVMIQDGRGGPVNGAAFMVSYANREEKGSDVNVAAHLLLGLLRAEDDVAIRVLDGLGVDPTRVRQQVIQLVSARQVQEEPRSGRATGRGKRKLLSELRGRLDSLEWRLSVLEQRVGTSPDLPQLDQEIIQLRSDKESAIDAQTSRMRRCFATGNSNCLVTKPLACKSGQPSRP